MTDAEIIAEVKTTPFASHDRAWAWAITLADRLDAANGKLETIREIVDKWGSHPQLWLMLDRLKAALRPDGEEYRNG